MLILNQPDTKDIDRTEAFAKFAQLRAKEAVIVPPTQLPKAERRLHVRRTLREDHQFRIHNKPEGAEAKFNKLAKSPFKFFRGTALLYYRDYAGLDGHLPTVFTLGDVHPENFGVMPNEDGAPFFGLNDFDEAYFAPFSWDVKRGAVGFYIVAKENGLSKKKRRKVVKAFVKGYLDGLVSFASDDREKWFEFRIDNSPDMIKDLIESAKESRRSFLKEMVDLKKGKFTSSEEIVPHTRHVAKFQEVIDAYRDNNEIGGIESQNGHYTVKDVAVKKGSGTASLGLERYFVLIEGPSDDHADDIVLEMKHARQSALHGLVPDSNVSEDDKAERIIKAHDIQLVGGDPYYGYAKIDGQSFLVRERSPFKDDIDVDDLSKKELKKYANICGLALAHAHARSDEDTGVMAGDAEKRILASIDPTLFKADVVRFAKTAAKRIDKDYKLFLKDHKLGAFNFVDDGRG